ncbi:hypothetical protein Tsubulata_046934, partial [Turnera subulata]
MPLEDPDTDPHRPVPFIQGAAFVSGSGMICGLDSLGSLVIYRFSPLPCVNNIYCMKYHLQLLLHCGLEALNPHLPVSTFGQPFPSFFPVDSHLLPGTPSRAITCLDDNILCIVETTHELFPPDNFVPIYFTTFRLEVNQLQLPPYDNILCIKPLHSTFRLGRGGDLDHLRILCAYPSSDVAHCNRHDKEALATATTLSRDQDLSDHYYSKLDAEFFKLFCLRPERSDYTRCLYSRFKDRLEARSPTDGNVEHFLRCMSPSDDPFVFVNREFSAENHSVPSLNADLYL